MLVQSLGWDDPLEKDMATTPVFLPGKFHRQEEPGGCMGPWGCKELNTAERLGTGHA